MSNDTTGSVLTLEKLQEAIKHASNQRYYQQPLVFPVSMYNMMITKEVGNHCGHIIFHNEYLQQYYTAHLPFSSYQETEIFIQDYL